MRQDGGRGFWRLFRADACTVHERPASRASRAVREIVEELGRSTDTFGRFIRQQAERIPDRIALKFETEQLSYGAYDREVNRLAAAVAGAGVRARDPIALLCLNSPLFLVGLGAIAKLGAIGALINTHVGGAGLTH